MKDQVREMRLDDYGLAMALSDEQAFSVAQDLIARLELDSMQTDLLLKSTRRGLKAVRDTFYRVNNPSVLYGPAAQTTTTLVLETLERQRFESEKLTWRERRCIRKNKLSFKTVFEENLAFVLVLERMVLAAKAACVPHGRPTRHYLRDALYFEHHNFYKYGAMPAQDRLLKVLCEGEPRVETLLRQYLEEDSSTDAKTALARAKDTVARIDQTKHH